MLRDPDKQAMEKAYARWAPIYDALCGPVFVNGRRAATQAAREVSGRILEIGVGTGLSFGDHDATTEITGIDISEPMIARAREDCREFALRMTWEASARIFLKHVIEAAKAARKLAA